MKQNISHDELHDLANHHALTRQIMGVERGFGYRTIHSESAILLFYKNHQSRKDETY